MLRKHGKTNRGFDLVEFSDSHGNRCSLQQSSAVGGYEDSLENPGSSFVWLGIDDADPKILKSDALKLGLRLPPGEVSGWMPFQVPDQVMFSTRMHLSREHVEGLIEHLQRWLSTGELSEQCD